jgi:hypothetical protein
VACSDQLRRERVGGGGFEAGDVGAAGVGGEEAVAAAEAGGVAHLGVAAVEIERGELAREGVIEPVTAEADLVVPQRLGAVGERVGGRADAGVDVDAAGFVSAGYGREQELRRP